MQLHCAQRRNFQKLTGCFTTARKTLLLAQIPIALGQIYSASALSGHISTDKKLRYRQALFKRAGVRSREGIPQYSSTRTHRQPWRSTAPGKWTGARTMRNSWNRWVRGALWAGQAHHRRAALLQLPVQRADVLLEMPKNLKIPRRNCILHCLAHLQKCP